MLAVSAPVWGLFTGVIAGSFLVLARALLKLWRGMKEFSAAARAAADELSRTMEGVASGLEEIRAGLGRVEEGLSRKRRPPSRI